ncbi:choice-of-anchor L domain-containing protein [Aureivirga sp. CE67]|uniref:choice-of-anchor L domain-containing protein n=1 Tax=Aureivirga sp. CE67 TaxID=1788983 RepID=UPI0018CB1E87|nr:choice-of-anchor L domain-containing protein [Aureivirga sp. CE67]
MVKKLLYGCAASLLLSATAYSQKIQINPENISASTMKPKDLVEQVLLSGECTEMGWISHTTNDGTFINDGTLEYDIEHDETDRTGKSYGFFKRVTENFPFQNGIVMTSGKAYRAGNTDISSTLGDGSEWGSWWYENGDDHLLSIIQSSSVPRPAVRNVTIFEFTFVPLVSNLEFDYIFASEEYGSFECSYSDVFAFILSGPGISDVNEYDGDADSTTPPVSLDLGGKNIAVVPNTTIPVMVTNVHSGALCTIEQETYEFYDSVNSGNGAINFNAQTVELTAQHPVTPGETYTIKLAIADAGDAAYDSGVFLEGGSFDLGILEDPDEPHTQTNGNALCENGGSLEFGYTEEDIVNHSESMLYAFLKITDDETIVVQEASDDYTYTITEPGTYQLVGVFPGVDHCVKETNPVIIEYYPLPEIPEVTTIEECTVDDITIDFSNKVSEILAGYDEELYIVEFFNSEEAAEDFGSTPITEMNLEGNSSAYVYVRVLNKRSYENYLENPDESQPCYREIFSFELKAYLTPTLADSSDFTELYSCDNDSYGTATDNIVLFDLTVQEQDIFGEYSAQDYTLEYATDADFNNIIADPTTYANVDSPMDQTIYVRLINKLKTDCIGDTSFKLHVEPYANADCSVTIPEGFSPNGNGINDTFYVKGLVEHFPNYKIEFYNRWGNIVYTDTNGNYWNGQLDGDKTRVAAGVYYYVLYYNDGSLAPYQGKLFLNR